MAETLGSLLDKLSIKVIRQYHIEESIQKNTKEDSIIQEKLKIVKSQKKDLIEEIDSFLEKAFANKVKIKEEKVKLYNPTEYMDKIPEAKSIGKAASYLIDKNLELWHLEDEARRRDVSDDYIGKIKRKIDLTNQQRNDLIDKVDELLEEAVKE